MKPIDIEMRKFKKARFGGYNADDVNEFLAQVVRHYEDLQRNNTSLDHKINSLNEKIDYYKNMETTLQNTMIFAERTAQEAKVRAEQEAEQIILEGTFKADQMVEEARQEVYMVKQNIEGLKKQYDAAKRQVKQLLQSQIESLDMQSFSLEEFSSVSDESGQIAASEDKPSITTTSQQAKSEKLKVVLDAPKYDKDEEDNYYTKEYKITDEEGTI